MSQIQRFKSLLPVVIGAMVCAGHAMADGQLIDDFSNATESEWRFVADTVMGGVSSGQITFSSENGTAYAQLTGNVSTENNGGFIQARKQLSSRPSSTTKGIRLVARGNSQKYYLHLRTVGTVLPWQYYQAGFNVTSEWKEFRIPLTDFKRSGSMLAKVASPSGLKSVAIVAYGRDHEADVQVMEISFY